MRTNGLHLGTLIIPVILIILLGFAGAAGAAGVAPDHDSSTITVNGYVGSTYQSSLPVTDVYLIQNESNWQYVVADINSGKSTYTSANLVLTTDIAFSSDIASLGSSSSNSFSGCIYGNGYKFINFKQSGSTAHGLIYYAGDGCELNNVYLVDANIDSNTKYVGGLVGKTQNNANVKLYGCSVVFSTIKTTGSILGGLVGDASSATLSINASLVNCAYVYSDSNTVGGMVGLIDKGSIADSRVNGSEISATGDMVGGLTGQLGSTSSMYSILLKNNIIKDCKVHGSQFVGGLLGFVNTNNCVIDGCLVEQSSVTTKLVNIGGLIGYTIPITFSGAQTSVQRTWVNGISYLGSLIGYGIGSSGIAPTHTEVWSSTGTKSTTATDENFDNISTADYAFQVAGIGSAIDRYGYAPGKDYGYTLYTVTVATDGHGSAGTDNGNLYRYGANVKLNSSPAVGYHFDTWTSAEVSGITGDMFTMPAKAVTVTANFAGNKTTVRFTNETGTVSLDNIFASPVNKPANPVKPGYTFVRWNITEDAGATWKPLESYLKSGMWNYTGEHNGMLSAYANWTLTPLYITNITDNGLVISSQNIANIGDTIHLEAIPNSGYHFSQWTVTDTTGNITVDSNGDFIMPATDVNAAALFLGNVTDVTFDNGTGVSSYSNVVGYALQKPTDPTKEGYVFAGWNVTFDGGATWESLDSYIKDGKWNYHGVHSGTLTVYADWALPGSTTTYKPQTSTTKEEELTQILPSNAYSNTIAPSTAEDASSSVSLPVPTNNPSNIGINFNDQFPYWVLWIIFGSLAGLFLIIFFIIKRRKDKKEDYPHYRKLSRRRRKGWL